MSYPTYPVPYYDDSDHKPVYGEVRKLFVNGEWNPEIPESERPKNWQEMVLPREDRPSTKTTGVLMPEWPLSVKERPSSKGPRFSERPLENLIGKVGRPALTITERKRRQAERTRAFKAKKRRESGVKERPKKTYDSEGKPLCFDCKARIDENAIRCKPCAKKAKNEARTKSRKAGKA